jgi:hypothetical protein
MAAHNEDTGTWCLYVTEFTEVYTSDSAGVLGQEECRALFTDKYARRVGEQDYRIVPMRDRQPSRYRLELLLPNLRGEWKDEIEALDQAEKAEKPGAIGVVLVERGSREEAELKATLRRRLRDE